MKEQIDADFISLFYFVCVILNEIALVVCLCCASESARASLVVFLSRAGGDFVAIDHKIIHRERCCCSFGRLLDANCTHFSRSLY